MKYLKIILFISISLLIFSGLTEAAKATTDSECFNYRLGGVSVNNCSFCPDEYPVCWVTPDNRSVCYTASEAGKSCTTDTLGLSGKCSAKGECVPTASATCDNVDLYRPDAAGDCVSCSSGSLNCNKNNTDGCEINANTDNKNCGSCGNKCDSGANCVAGKCVSPVLCLDFPNNCSGQLPISCNSADECNYVELSPTCYSAVSCKSTVKYDCTTLNCSSKDNCSACKRTTYSCDPQRGCVIQSSKTDDSCVSGCLSGACSNGLCQTGGSSGADSSGSICEPGQICNPLKYSNFDDLASAISKFLFTVAIALAPVLFAIGGIMIVTAGGNPIQVQKAQKLLLYTAIGLVVIMLAQALIAVLKNVIGVKETTYLPMMFSGLITSFKSLKFKRSK